MSGGRGLRRAAIGSVVVVLGVLLAALCVGRTPAGRFGLLVRNGKAVAPLQPPGIHLHGPLTRLINLPGGPRLHRGRLRTRTAEGAARTTPFRAEFDLEKGRIEQLEAIARSILAGHDLDTAIDEIVAEASGTDPRADPDRLTARLAGLGIVAGSLRLGRSHAASGNRNPLRDAYMGPRWPLLLIGIDAADWDMIDPLIEAGELPRFKALRDRGAWGTLHSMSPTLSPILWTTIATGRPPEQHGIVDFLMKDPATGAEVPISRSFRRVKALWNIATDLDLSSLTVAWWATWPAEIVNGWMVTDRLAYSLFDLPLPEHAPGIVFPPSLLEEIADSRVAEDSVTYEDVRGIVGIGRERFEASRGALNTPDGYRDPVTHLIKILASTWTYHRIAARLLRQHRPEVSLVYYEGIDEVNHRFAQYLPPLMNQVRDVKPQLRAAYANAVPNFYRLQDRLIGELLEAADPNSVIMVVSDHGFANGGERPVKEPPDVDGKPGLWHRMDGVFIVAGPPVHPGRLRAPVQLLDVMPTVLALLDLPVAGDMPGHPVRDVFEAARGPESPAVEVTSYDAIGAPLESGGGTASVMDDEMMAKLTALGYIQAGADNGAETATYHVNSGHIFLQKHDLDRAHAEFARAREIAPNFDQPYLGLAQVEVMRGKLDRALPFIEKAITVVPAPQPALLTRAARIFAMAGRYDEGIAFLQSLPLEGREDAFRQAAMGMLHEKAGNTPEAMVAYKKALRLDPSVLPALRGLYALLRDGPLEELAEILQASLHAEQAVVAVRAANWLALTRERQGRTKEALEILRQAVRDDPDDLMTRTNLGSLLVNQDRPGEGLPHLERAQDLSPGSLEVQVNLIVAYGKLGDLDKARTQFEKARQGARDVDMPDVYNAIAYACFLNHAVRDASKFVDLSLGIKPGQKAALRLKDLIARAAGG